MLAAVVLGLGAACATERPADTSVIIPVGGLGSSPVPTLYQNRLANFLQADLMFLRLADLPASLETVGDDGTPRLAASWERRDPVTLVFHLDPRAQWHDGTPVTARDVVFAFDRARDPNLTPELAPLLSTMTDIVAEDEATVVVRFDRPYAEQFYNATFHVQPLPAHLLEHLHPDSVATSDFLQAPVGNGPYRWGEFVAGQHLVLEANPSFYLGAPEVDRVMFLRGGDYDARLNLLLSGEANTLRNVSIQDVERIEADPGLRVLTTESYTVAYLLFNQFDPHDLERPHPILSDVRVRQALIHALDRKTMLEAVFGASASVPPGPVSRLHWIRDTTDSGAPYDPGRARELLRQAGWTFSDDGWIRNGEPLALTLNYPVSSRPRSHFAQLIQEQWRQIGVRLELNGMDGPTWSQRRRARDFDLDFSSAGMDPSPAGIQQSWSCAGIGGSNVAHYCNPLVDSLLAAATFAAGETRPQWQAVLEMIERDAPAAFIYSPPTIFGVHRRFGNVEFPPYSYWSAIWRWTVTDSR
jgi:peptide/nickel transport system substrate-binding protein